MNRNGINGGDTKKNGPEGMLWGVGAGLAALGTAAIGYWLSQGSNPPSRNSSPSSTQNSRNMNAKTPSNSKSTVGQKPSKNVKKKKEKPENKSQPATPATNPPEQSTSVTYVTNFLQKLATSPASNSSAGRRGVPKTSIPIQPALSNLNALLADVYLRYIALNDEEFALHYKVFMGVFNEVHKKMKEVDPYYNKYSSTVQFAGSHSDKLRIKKPDEFDMDIIIGLPLSIKNDPKKPEDSDFVFEPKSPGFVQLKMGVQYQRLLMRDNDQWLINKAAYEWKDDRNYLLRSKFMDWFKSVVAKALNKFLLDAKTSTLPLFYVEGVPYTVRRSESGPAMTLFIENKSRGFKLDVDLVPALKFPEDRWPLQGEYRDIPKDCSAPQKVWMVVPKPNKDAQTEQDKSRSWRIALHDQEGKLMHGSNNMKQAIRLIKKLRDSQDMKKIASYYIKTLFFWEIVERNDKTFWSQNNPAELFKIMVKKFHGAMVAKKIPYFWNKKNNLIGNVDAGTLAGYAAKLANLIKLFDNPLDYKQVARFLLTPAEFKEYNDKFLHI